MIEWKDISETPTEHWEKNAAVSPEYIVKCEGTDSNGNSILGYACYSFAANKWLRCFKNTVGYCCNVIAWTEERL